MFKTTTEEHNEQQVKYRNSMLIELGGIGYFKGAGTGVRTSFIQGSREHRDAGEGQQGLFPDSTHLTDYDAVVYTLTRQLHGHGPNNCCRWTPTR